MQSAWVERDAKAAIDHWGKVGVSADIALRVYSTRLLGRDRSLVLHGGGNTSVKTRIKDLLGEEADVLASRVRAPTWPPSTPPACPRSASKPCANCVHARPCATRTWCRSS